MQLSATLRVMVLVLFNMPSHRAAVLIGLSTKASHIAVVNVKSLGSSYDNSTPPSSFNVLGSAETH